MRRFIAVVFVCAFAVLTAFQAHASLNVLGRDDLTNNQLIYDDVKNVTWYDWSRPANTHSNAMKWADELVLQFNCDLYSDWRLPTVCEFKQIFEMGVRTDDPYDIFENLRKQRYWLINDGYVFDMINGDVEKASSIYSSALAVSPGQVPIPGAVWLLGTGLVGLIGLKRKKKK